MTPINQGSKKISLAENQGSTAGGSVVRQQVTNNTGASVK